MAIQPRLAARHLDHFAFRQRNVIYVQCACVRPHAYGMHVHVRHLNACAHVALGSLKCVPPGPSYAHVIDMVLYIYITVNSRNIHLHATCYASPCAHVQYAMPEEAASYKPKFRIHDTTWHIQRTIKTPRNPDSKIHGIL